MGVIIFKVGDNDLGWTHVRTAAEFRGDLESVRSVLRHSIVARDYAEEELFESEENALQTAFDEFRYERKLLSGQLAAAWLRARGLSLDDVADFLDRRYWLGRFSQLVPNIEAQYPVPEDEVGRLLWSEVVCSGKLADLALPLAYRLAVRVDEKDWTPGAKDLDEALETFLTSHQLQVSGLEEWRVRKGCEQGWFEMLLEMEALLYLKVRSLATTERCAREMHAQRLPLTRVEVDSLLFDSMGQAQESYLSLAMNAETLEEVAVLSGAARCTLCEFLQDLDSEFHDRFLSAAEGEVLHPFEHKGKFWVCRMKRKVDPELTDPLVKRALKDRIVRPYLDNLTDKYVRWQFALT